MRVPAMEGGGRSLDRPAQSGRRQVRKPLAPDQIERHADPLGGQHQPPRRGKIERLGIARYLPDDEGQGAASYPFLHRPERIGAVAGFDMEQARAQGCRQAVDIGTARAAHAFGILHPQPWRTGPARPPQRRERERHSVPRRIIMRAEQFPQRSRQVAIGRPVIAIAGDRGRQLRGAQQSQRRGQGIIIGLWGRDGHIGIGHKKRLGRLYVLVMFSLIGAAIKASRPLRCDHFPRKKGFVLQAQNAAERAWLAKPKFCNRALRISLPETLGDLLQNKKKAPRSNKGIRRPHK